MKRILITNGHLNVGGVEKSLINLLQMIDYSKYQVDLLLFEGLGDYHSDIPSEVNVILCDLTKTYGSFVQVVHNNLNRPKVIYQKFILTMANKVSHRFFKYLRISNKYDIAIAYRMDMPLYYVAHGIKAKRKYFWWHNGVFDYTKRTLQQWRISAKKMDGLVFVSEPIQKLIEPYFRSYVKDFFVIPNSINFKEIYQKAGNKNPYDPGYRNIVSVGRLSAEKHMADCVFAAEKLVEKGIDNFKWYLIGDGTQWNEIQHQIRIKNLSKYVICMGSLSNPYPYMKFADLFVHPSYVESQGISVLEAMALEKLIVCVGSEGVMTFAKDRINAVVCQKNIDSLVDSIENAMKMDADKIHVIQKNAVLTAESYSDNIIWEIIEKQLLEDK